jgi:hemolysin III
LWRPPVLSAARVNISPEELANAITHGFGVALSIAGLVLLLVTASLHGDAWGVSSSAVFGATPIVLYSVSTLYHSLPGARRKFLLRKFDHAAIFLLIAGTYTPVLLVSLRGAWG